VLLGASPAAETPEARFFTAPVLQLGVDYALSFVVCPVRATERKRHKQRPLVSREAFLRRSARGAAGGPRVGSADMDIWTPPEAVLQIPTRSLFAFRVFIFVESK